MQKYNDDEMAIKMGIIGGKSGDGGDTHMARFDSASPAIAKIAIMGDACSAVTDHAVQRVTETSEIPNATSPTTSTELAEALEAFLYYRISILCGIKNNFGYGTLKNVKSTFIRARIALTKYRESIA